VAILLALVSAIIYGTADFLGGLASRRAAALAVTFVSQGVGLMALLIVVPLAHGDGFDRADFAWGAAGGLSGAIALVCFYWALAAGAMTVVAPLTAVVSAIVPVVTGLALGERPSVWALIGVGLAIPAIALIAREHADRPQRLTRTVFAAALAAGLGFGVFFVALSRTSGHSGLWPLVGARVAAVASLTIVLIVTRHPPRLAPRARPLTIGAGLLDTTANAVYLAAATRGLLALVAVIAALYPASTVVLARVVLGERIERSQVGGFVLAALAVSLVAAAS
jgi:drug/metabolite transporter (DMT)-like permease